MKTESARLKLKVFHKKNAASIAEAAFYNTLICFWYEYNSVHVRFYIRLLEVSSLQKIQYL